MSRGRHTEVVTVEVRLNLLPHRLSRECHVQPTVVLQWRHPSISNRISCLPSSGTLHAKCFFCVCVRVRNTRQRGIPLRSVVLNRSHTFSLPQRGCFLISSLLFSPCNHSRSRRKRKKGGKGRGTGKPILQPTHTIRPLLAENNAPAGRVHSRRSPRRCKFFPT